MSRISPLARQFVLLRVPVLGTEPGESSTTAKDQHESDSAAGGQARQQAEAVRPFHPSLSLGKNNCENNVVAQSCFRA